MKYNLIAAASESAFYDTEAQAVWINFLLSDYHNGKLNFTNLKKINSTTDRLVKILAHLGMQASGNDFEIDLPIDSGDQIGSVVFFFKDGEMPEEKEISKYANKAEAKEI